MARIWYYAPETEPDTGSGEISLFSTRLVFGLGTGAEEGKRLIVFLSKKYTILTMSIFGNVEPPKQQYCFFTAKSTPSRVRRECGMKDAARKGQKYQLTPRSKSLTHF